MTTKFEITNSIEAKSAYQLLLSHIEGLIPNNQRVYVWQLSIINELENALLSYYK